MGRAEEENQDGPDNCGRRNKPLAMKPREQKMTPVMYGRTCLTIIPQMCQSLLCAVSMILFLITSVDNRAADQPGSRSRRHNSRALSITALFGREENTFRVMDGVTVASLCIRPTRGFFYECPLPTGTYTRGHCKRAHNINCQFVFSVLCAIMQQGGRSATVDQRDVNGLPP
jgi:hypothetical protein